MKRNFRKLLSVVLSLVMVLACLTSVSITTLAEDATPEEVVVKKGPFDFTDPTDLSYGSGATVENGKLKVGITKGGNAKIRIPYELKSGTTYSVRYKLKAVSEENNIYLSLWTAYAKNVDSWAGVIDHQNHIAHTLNRGVALNEWVTVAYEFTAEIPTEDCKYLGFFIQANNIAGTLYIDNLQIAPVVESSDAPDSALFDFSDASHLEAAMGTYWSGSSTVEDGKLNITIPSTNYRMKTRFPFTLQNGAIYKVRYEITLEATKSINLYFAYASDALDDNMILHSNAAYRIALSSGSLAAGTYVIEKTFTAEIPATGYEKLGLLFWANTDNVTFSVDNLEIMRLDCDSATFDFSKTSDLDYAAAKYGNGSAAVADGKLNLSLQNNRCMKVRLPFVFQDGKEYKLKYELTLSENKALLLGIANSSSSNSYDGMFNESNRLTISNGNRTAGTHTIEYTFVANITDASYNQLGLIIWATAADAMVSVDNLEISVVDTEKAYFDFCETSNLEYGYITYSNVAFQEEMVKVSIPVANGRAKMKFPFTLETGETYRVRFDIKAETSKQEQVYIAYAGSGTGEDVIIHASNKIAGGWQSLGSDFKSLEYTFTADCPANNDHLGIFINAGSTAGNTIYIDNLYIVKDYLVPNTPNAPEMASHTANAITLLDMSGYEYKMDDGEWQDSAVFTDLVQGRRYSFYQRAKASDIYPATAASQAFEYFIANYGDADRSGEVDTVDLVLICKVLLGVDEVYDEFAADLNNDGVINIIDFVKLKKVLVQKTNPVTPDFLSSSYELAWNDEFDGDSLDNTKWNTGAYSIENVYGGSTYIAENNNAGVLDVADGYLKLNNYAVQNESDGMDYYTPEICTNQTYNFSYGYFEMRAKLTSGNPLWHSFWACGSNTDEMPYRAEIDVIETYSNGANNGTYDYTVHSWWDKDATNLPDGMADDTTGHKVLVNGNATDYTFASEFHNYGCLWTKTSLTFYLDGEVLREVVFAEDENSDYFLALKDGNPMFLILSLSTARQEAGTDNPVTINNETLADQVMLVDYVRVYQDTVIGG